MKTPLSIRHVRDDERAALEAELRRSAAFTVCRCQIWLASAERHKPAASAKTLCGAPQTVRNVLHAATRRQVCAILYQSPRTFGQRASVWTLKRLAAVCHEQGLSDTTLLCPTMLDAMVRLGVSWPRAKHWMVRPDHADEGKNTPRPADPDGRAPRGERAVGAVPHHYGANVTMLAALSRQGVAAVMTIDGATAAAVFRAYVEHVLCPTLGPGDIVIMDNLRAPKVAGIHERIEAYGARVISWPPDSPDLSPIEPCWSKLKTL